MHEYKLGMFGGKFMPFHKGHLYCVDEALKWCDRLYLILFVNGKDEDGIIQSYAQRASGGEYDWLKLMPDARWKKVQEVAARYNGRVIPLYVDVSSCRTEDGIPLIEGINADEENIIQTAAFLKELPHWRSEEHTSELQSLY